MAGLVVLGAGAVIHRRGRVLVVKRAEEPDRGLWTFPGGRVEVGETPQETARREAKEEVGLDIELEGLFEVVTYMPRELRGTRRWDQVVIVDYLARPVGGRVRLNSESEAFRWVTPSELYSMPTTQQMVETTRKFEQLSKS